MSDSSVKLNSAAQNILRGLEESRLENRSKKGTFLGEICRIGVPQPEIYEACKILALLKEQECWIEGLIDDKQRAGRKKRQLLRQQKAKIEENKAEENTAEAYEVDEILEVIEKGVGVEYLAKRAGAWIGNKIVRERKIERAKRESEEAQRNHDGRKKRFASVFHVSEDHTKPPDIILNLATRYLYRFLKRHTERPHEVIITKMLVLAGLENDDSGTLNRTKKRISRQ